jgi:hypothetical protein
MVCRSVNGKCQLILLGVMLVILGTCCAVARVFFTPLTENMQFSDFLFSASAAVAGSIGAIVLHLSYLTLLCKIPNYCPSTVSHRNNLRFQESSICWDRQMPHHHENTG